MVQSEVITPLSDVEIILVHSRCILIIHNNKCVSREGLVKWPGNLTDIGQSRHSSLSRGDNAIRYGLRNQFPWNPSCACSLRYVTFQERRMHSIRASVFPVEFPPDRYGAFDARDPSVGRQTASEETDNNMMFEVSFFFVLGGRNCGSCSAVVEAHHRRASTAVV